MYNKDTMKEKCTKCAKFKCPMHPDYQAKIKPKCSCETCWELWEKRQNETVDKSVSLLKV